MLHRVPFPARAGRARLPALPLSAALLALACAREPAAAVAAATPAPSIVLVTLDTTRADHLTPYGYLRDTTPWLAAFAREALVFERFVVPMATTLPTHTSILTGTHPLEHGVLGNLKHTGHLFSTSSELRSFAEACARAGYATGAFVSAVPLKRGTGVETGFERFDEPEGAERRAADTNARVFAWLDEVGERPFFLWVHYFDAHHPLEPPPEYAQRFTADAELARWIAERRIAPRIERKKTGEVDLAERVHDLYDAELAYVDDALRALFERLAALPAWSDARVVIAGDHGDALNQHGKTGHGGTWHEELHAPLLLRAPGLAARRVPGLVTAADVLPTLIGTLPAEPFAAFREQASGRDVLAPGFEPSAIVSQDTGRGAEDEDKPFYRYALTDERWKLQRVEWRADPGQQRERVTYRLFDLAGDPFELEDVAAREPERVERMAAELAARLAELRERGRGLASSAAGQELDAARLEELRGLGYAGGD